MTLNQINKKWYSNPMYYNSTTIQQLRDTHGHSVDIALVFSGRNRGKSFDISSRALLDAWNTKGQEQFGYCRRFDTELKNYMVEEYFNDKLDFIKDISNGKANGVVVYNGSIYFSNTTDKDGKAITERLFKIGNTFALSTSRNYKSLQFPNITRLIVEEVFTDGAYIPDEPIKLLNLISTIQRGRDNFICYMISNTVSRINPYVEAFGLVGLVKMKSGTVDTYKLYNNTYDKNGNEQYYYIACEYLADADSEQTTKKKKDGKTRTSVLNNTWDEARLYPIASQKDIDSYETIYRCVFQNNAFLFYGQIKEVPINYQEYVNALMNDEEAPKLSDDLMTVMFITRKTTPYKNDVRLFTTQAVVYPLATRGLIPLCESDKTVAKLIEIGHTYYANNLIANEFSQCYKILKGTRGI